MALWLAIVAILQSGVFADLIAAIADLFGGT